MPTPQQFRDRLLKKLKELFQLDQPDLDFGFYRIMHAKSKQVEEFLDKDLLKIVADAFGQASEPRKAELQAAYEKSIQTAKEFGAANPEETEPVKKAKAALETLKDTVNSEGEVYDHLYRFFERYYEDGDFISRRYHTRENAGKAAPYAVPYNGEEVKLHWANADQYYIKTAEYFSNYTFDLTQSAEIRSMKPEERLLNSIPEKPVYVHFHIVEATEGEHGNVRATEATKRFFIIHNEKPVEVNDAGHLTINFEYRPDPEKTGQEGTWRAKRNSEAAEAVLSTLETMVKESGALNAYLQLLKIPAPTDSDRNRPLMAKYINQYTAHNTMDYFIHKDLGGFLRRELDFYIKNEVMRLDDIENAEAPAVESYLAKIKVLRKIAGKLIDFLSQLEDFQKKLWLKKKFVVETNYCITLDRVPEELYPEIAANEAQHDEWVKLFAINEIEHDTTGNPGYAKPLTVDFLKANNKLVLDTQFFDDAFKAILIATIENFDEQCNGLLIHSENFQGMQLILANYSGSVKFIYVDPPYNTGKDDFLYKDNYQHSSWLSFITDRIALFYKLLCEKGAMLCSIDDNEAKNLEWACNAIFGDTQMLAPLFIQVRYANKTLSEDNDFQRTIEHVLFYAKDKRKFKPIKDVTDYPLDKFEWKISEKQIGTEFTVAGKRCSLFKPGEYELEKVEPSLEGLKETWATGSLTRQKGSSGEFFETNLAPRKAIDGLGCLYKVDGIGEDGLGYRYFTGPQRETATKGKFFSGIPLQTLEKIKAGDSTKEVPIHNFFDFAGDFGNCRQEGRVDIRGGKKPEKLLERLITFTSMAESYDIIFDPFSGSGTATSVAHKLNKKYVAMEQGEYFDTKVLVRMKYTLNGLAGSIESKSGGMFKYLRLESYEDALNNLRFDENPVRDKTISAKASLKEDYMLRYLLDVETRDSQSLLNVDAFADPTSYTLRVKKPGTDEYTVRHVDLIETFNYLIGLRVVHIAVPQTFTAEFKRLADPEVPEDQKTKLVTEGNIQQIKNHQSKTEIPVWWFRKVEGWVPKDQQNPNNDQREKVLIVWRKLTGDLEKDNLMLDEWFQKNRISTRDFEFDTIYVNGSNNLPNLVQEGDTWKVRLIEEEFLKRMWEAER